MTNDEVAGGFTEVYNELWLRYRDRQPGDTTKEWQRMHTRAAVLKRKYPLLEEVINRMMTEIIERARGRGRVPGDVHRPPGG